MVAFLNHVTISAPRNATTSHTVDPASGTTINGTLFTPTAGRFLLCICGASVTSGSNTAVPTAAPTGWTGPTSNQAVNNAGLYVWYKTAAGADTITTLHNASNYPVVYEFYEFPSGTTWNKASAATNQANGATLNLASLTGTNWIGGAYAQGVVDTSGSSAVAWSAGTESTDTFILSGGSPATDGVIFSSAYTENSVATSAAWGSTVTLTSLTTTPGQERLMWALVVGAGGTDATVTAVRTTAAASFLPPTVAGTSPNATVTAVPAAAAAVFPPPGVSAGVNGSVTAVTATASASAPPPVLSTSTTVTAVRTQASGVFQVPTIEGEAAVSGGGPATASAVFLPPAVTATRSATVVSVPATASAVALPPGVSAGGSVTVTAAPTTATATVLPPAVTATRSATVLAVPTTAVAVALPPVASTTGSATVVAVPATAIAVALPPIVSTSSAVTATSATASGIFRPPTVDTAGNATVQAAAAQAYAAVLAPVVLAVRNATVVAVRAGATATMRTPGVTGAGAVGPILSRSMVAILRDDGRYAGRVQGKDRYGVRLR